MTAEPPPWDGGVVLECSVAVPEDGIDLLLRLRRLGAGPETVRNIRFRTVGA